MKLKGKTQKGKNRIRELGEDWVLIRESDSVLFSKDVGPWLLVQPISFGVEKSRWINKFHDVDFEIVSH